jgi:hypothetical protein
VNRKTSTIQMSIIKVIKKGNVILVEFFNNIHELNIQIEENHTYPQER